MPLKYSWQDWSSFIPTCFLSWNLKGGRIWSWSVKELREREHSS